MKQVNLPEMSTDQLVERFVRIALDQHQCIKVGDNERYSRLYKQMKAVEEELKARNGDARSVLLKLYNYPDIEVRLKAAKATLAVAPLKARAALETIRVSKTYPAAIDAGSCLECLDRGIYKPT